jgi:hypothetical protein
MTGEVRDGHCGLVSIEEPVADFHAALRQPPIIITT